MGSITIELFQAQAPASVENFLKYVQDGFYPGTIFHRVVSGYVIQGGGYTADLTEKPTRPPVQNEATNGLSNQRGTVSMARTRAIKKCPRPNSGIRSSLRLNNRNVHKAVPGFARTYSMNRRGSTCPALHSVQFALGFAVVERLVPQESC